MGRCGGGDDDDEEEEEDEQGDDDFTDKDGDDVAPTYIVRGPFIPREPGKNELWNSGNQRFSDTHTHTLLI